LAREPVEVGSNARWDSEIACVATNHLTSPVEEDGTCRYDGELIPMSMVRFHLTADVSSDSPAAVRPVLEGLADATMLPASSIANYSLPFAGSSAGAGCAPSGQGEAWSTASSTTR
jgi:hypothetical protein